MARSRNSGVAVSTASGSAPTRENSIELEIDDATPVAWTSALARPGEAPSLRHDLPDVLRRLVEVSVELTCAACGGVKANGSEAWVHQVVLDDRELPSALGSVPVGRGRIDEVMNFDQPLPSGAGYLRVPVVVEGSERASVFLMNHDHQFSADDERLVERLMEIGASDIANAKRIDALAFRERWSVALNQLTGRSLRREDFRLHHLEAFVDCARELGEADLAFLAVREGGRASCTVLMASGLLADRVAGMHYRLEDSLTQRVIQDRRARVVAGADFFSDLGREVQSVVGSIAAAPLTAGDDHSGLLLLARKRGRLPFTDRELEMCGSFADQLGSLIERVRSTADHDSAIVEDRARIARDLHQHVVQQLFDIAVGLEATAARTVDPAASARISRRAEEIDDAIVAIRQTVFAFAGEGHPDPTGLRERLLHVVDVVDEVEEGLPSRPGMTFVGPIDQVVSPELADDVCAVVAQGLTSAAGRSDVSELGVVVSALEDRLVVELAYDGHGPDPAAQKSCVLGLRARAAAYGGDLLIRNDTRGTTLAWSVPIDR